MRAVRRSALPARVFVIAGASRRDEVAALANLCAEAVAPVWVPSHGALGVVAPDAPGAPDEEERAARCAAAEWDAQADCAAEEQAVQADWYAATGAVPEQDGVRELAAPVGWQDGHLAGEGSDCAEAYWARERADWGRRDLEHFRGRVGALSWDATVPAHAAVELERSVNQERAAAEPGRDVKQEPAVIQERAEGARPAVEAEAHCVALCGLVGGCCGRLRAGGLLPRQ